MMFRLRLFNDVGVLMNDKPCTFIIQSETLQIVYKIVRELYL